MKDGRECRKGVAGKPPARRCDDNRGAAVPRFHTYEYAGGGKRPEGRLSHSGDIAVGFISRII